MRFSLYILIFLSFSFSSCERKTDTTVVVQDVTLEEVDSGEMKELPPPPPPPPQFISISNCNCEALIDVESKKEIFLYNKPEGIIVKRLKHNFKDEDYLVATIRKWVYVSLKSDSKTLSGWLSPEMQCANPYTTCN